MSEQIRISPDQMRSRATQYRGEAEKVSDVIQQMDTLLQNLQSEWEGASSESYASRYAELKPSFKKCYDLINEIATALDKTAEILESTDADIANQFRG